MDATSSPPPSDSAPSSQGDSPAQNPLESSPQTTPASPLESVPSKGTEDPLTALPSFSDLEAQVQVKTEALEGRRRALEAHIWIPVGVDRLWEVLTDYEGLATFIPNLTRSQVLSRSGNQVRLEQVGAEQFWKFSFAAKVILAMELMYPEAIYFTLEEGDFKEFAGSWRLAPDRQEDNLGTRLTYQLTVHPKRTMPVKLVECHLGAGLSRNLAAIYQEALRREFL